MHRNMVSGIYSWAHRSYVIEPIRLMAARETIKHLSSKPELVKTIEALKRYNGGMVVSVVHVRKHKEK